MMNKKKFPRLARIAAFAAVMFLTGAAFAGPLIPIAHREDDLDSIMLQPTLLQPVNDGAGGELDRGPLLQPINAPGDIQPTAVPEPTTWGMLILGAGLLAGVRRFRRK